MRRSRFWSWVTSLLPTEIHTKRNETNARHIPSSCLSKETRTSSASMDLNPFDCPYNVYATSFFFRYKYVPSLRTTRYAPPIPFFASRRFSIPTTPRSTKSLPLLRRWTVTTLSLCVNPSLPSWFSSFFPIPQVWDSTFSYSFHTSPLRFRT